MDTDISPLDGMAMQAILQRQHEVVNEIAAMTVQQQSLIEADRVAGLLELLNNKQFWLAELAKLQSELAPFQEVSATDRYWPDPSLREQSQKTADASEQLLQKILMLESHCQALLEQSRSRIVQQIHSIQEVMGAQEAYAENFSRESTHDFGLS